jgi:tetratricopeptide (TPR) repeat protein
MMSQTLKTTAALILSVFVLFMVYWGVYLPFRKAQLLVIAMKDFRTSKTIGDFENIFSRVLDFYSPTGQEESIKQFGLIVIELFKQKDLPRSVVEELLGFSQKYLDSLIKFNSGGYSSQNLLILGEFYQIFGARFNDSVYLEKAIEYFKKGLELSPQRPQFLYKLFNTYLIGLKDFSSAREIGEEILKYWPSDREVVEALEQLKS